MKDVFNGLKDAPLWLLLGSLAICLAVWLIGPLNALVPVSMRPLAPLVAFIFSVLSSFRLFSLVIQVRQSQLDRLRQAARLRHDHLYAPFVALFMDRHLTASTGILAPRLRNRVGNAVEAIASRRRLRAKVKGAWRALGDKMESTSAEMEYGGSFPLAEIKSIARAGQQHADLELLNLIRRADRSHYEEQPERGDVTDDEYALAVHIYAMHERLSKLLEH